MEEEERREYQKKRWKTNKNLEIVNATPTTPPFTPIPVPVTIRPDKDPVLQARSPRLCLALALGHERQRASHAQVGPEHRLELVGKGRLQPLRPAVHLVDGCVCGGVEV